jgi:hypothetical protein
MDIFISETSTNQLPAAVYGGESRFCVSFKRDRATRFFLLMFSGTGCSPKALT